MKGLAICDLPKRNRRVPDPPPPPPPLSYRPSVLGAIEDKAPHARNVKAYPSVIIALFVN